MTPDFRHFDPAHHPVPEVHRLLLAGVSPRPIAFAGTMSAEGAVNLSPFSFFNAFGANPPVVAFSPAFRGKTGTPKHTFLNLLATKECTISIVSHAMVEQMNLASAEYPEGIDEFAKAGLTKLPSVHVRPPGVAESPFVMECRLLQHVELGGKPSSGNLMIAEVVYFHVREDVWSGDRIDPRKVDAVARMGYDWYSRASGDALFHLPKPAENGIGFDALPPRALGSRVLTGNDLAKLAGVAELPDEEAAHGRWRALLDNIPAERFNRAAFYKGIHNYSPDEALEALLPAVKKGMADPDLIHQLAQLYLKHNDVGMAWEVLALETLR